MFRPTKEEDDLNSVEEQSTPANENNNDAEVETGESVMDQLAATLLASNSDTEIKTILR